MNDIDLQQILAQIAPPTEEDMLTETTLETFTRIINENYWPEEDKQNQTELDDTRRPRLTLRHLNKLRKVQELKKLEMLAHQDFVKTMYAEPEEPGAEF